MHKIKKNGETIYPATITDAVVDKKTKKNVVRLFKDVYSEIDPITINLSTKTKLVYGIGNNTPNIDRFTTVSFLKKGIKYTVLRKALGSIIFEGSLPVHNLLQFSLVDLDDSLLSSFFAYKSTDEYSDGSLNITPDQDCFLCVMGSWSESVAIEINVSTSSNVNDEIEKINNNLTSLNENVEILNVDVASYNDSIFKVSDIGIDDIAFDNGQYIKYSDGKMYSHASCMYSELLSVKEGFEINYRIYTIGSVIAVIAAYDAEGNYSIKNSVQASGAAGTFAWSEGTYTVPKGIYKIRITAHTTKPGQTISAKAIKSNIEENTKNIEEINKQIESINIPINQWSGKKWVALGTSITDTNNDDGPSGEATGKYTKYLSELSKMDLTNKGVSGAIIGGHILYYASHTNELKTCDIVTIEGGVNDWISSKPLGKVGDTIPYLVEFSSPVWNNGGSEDGTFAGACYQVIKQAMENAPNAQIVVITDNTGKIISSTGANCAREKKNSIDLIQKDYTDMLISVANYMGVPVINAGQKSMINEENDQYLIDQIHHTELGGKQYAYTIWSELKNINNKSI